MHVLLFDFDGVIVDSAAAIIKLFQFFHTTYGTPNCKDTFDLQKFYHRNVYDYFIAHGLARDKVPLMIHDTEVFLKRHNHRIPFFRGMPLALIELSKSNIIYIISSGHGTIIKEKLAEHALLPFVREILGAEIAARKTDKINIIKKRYPDAIITYIGDTVGDILEGKQAGVSTVAVTWGYHPKELLATQQPDVLCDKPSELVFLLKHKKLAL